ATILASRQEPEQSRRVFSGLLTVRGENDGRNLQAQVASTNCRPRQVPHFSKPCGYEGPGRRFLVRFALAGVHRPETETRVTLGFRLAPHARRVELANP